MSHSSNWQFMSRVRRAMCLYSYKQAWHRIVAAQIDPWKKILKSCRQPASTSSISTVLLQIESRRSECQDTSAWTQRSPEETQQLIRANGSPELAHPQVVPGESQPMALGWHSPDWANRRHSLNRLPVWEGGWDFYGKNILGLYQNYYGEKDQK